MILRTVVRDCLLLSWALPQEVLPPLPQPLRYEAHTDNGAGCRVITTALLFFHEGARMRALPMLRFSYPQFGLATSILDGDGVPSLLLQRILVPRWVRPLVDLVTRQPAGGAKLEFDRPSRAVERDHWQWTVTAEDQLSVIARMGSDTGSLFPNCRDGVDYFRQRHRGYYRASQGYRGIETVFPKVEAWPMVAEVSDSGLLARSLPLGGEMEWPRPECAMLFPELPLTFELSLEPRIALSQQLPQPAARRSSVVEPLQRQAASSVEPPSEATASPPG